MFVSTKGSAAGPMNLRSRRYWKLLGKQIWKYKFVYLFMVMPTLFLIILFRYLPLPGIALSFKTFTPVYGDQNRTIYSFLFASKNVGFQHFQRMFIEPDFWRATQNTVVIAFLKLLIGFPFPIILALMINEVRYPRYKRVIQTTLTFPHFLSWVVVAGIILNIMGDSGIAKKLAVLIDPAMQQEWNVLYEASYFRPMLVILDIWKEAGWGTILYLAAITSIDPSLYEAATIDGASRLQRIWHISLPGILNMIIIMLILNTGNLMNVSFDQVFNLYSPPVYRTGDIIDTYVYRNTFQSTKKMDYGYTTAVGLFKNVINFVLLIAANQTAKALGHDGIM